MCWRKHLYDLQLCKDATQMLRYALFWQNLQGCIKNSISLQLCEDKGVPKLNLQTVGKYCKYCFLFHSELWFLEVYFKYLIFWLSAEVLLTKNKFTLLTWLFVWSSRGQLKKKAVSLAEDHALNGTEISVTAIHLCAINFSFSCGSYVNLHIVTSV